MKINNTIYQSKYVNPSLETVDIEGNEIYFRKENNHIVVEASLIPFVNFDQSISDYFFKQYSDIKYVMLERAAYTENEKLPAKVLKLKNFDNNFAIELPESIELYRASLGKKTRMHLGQYLRKLDKELEEKGGGFFTAKFTEDSRPIFDRITAMNRERCYTKGFEGGKGNPKLWDILRDTGFMNYLKIGDRIVAGTISSIYNNQLCLHVISHSNEYGKINPGNIILYKTIETALTQKISVFNFLWGDCEYKSRFGGKQVLLYDYYIFKKSSDYFLKVISSNLKTFVSQVKALAKKAFFPFYRILRWGYHHIIKRPPKSMGYILMLHRVDEMEDGHLWCNEHMKISPGYLDYQLKHIKEKYDIIPLSEVPQRIKTKSKRKFVVFTMDDGYKDNYTKALPVFKNNQAPYTIFVATDFPDKQAVLWWYELEDLLLKNESLTLNNGVTYPASNYEEKCDSFLRIREEILKLNQLDLENELNILFSDYKINWKSQCDKLCLSWDDIAQLKKEELVTIGGHTKHHYNLMQLDSEDEIKKEVMDGYNILKEKAQIEADVFAYPFGSDKEAGEREYKVLSALPFKCACIAYGGSCRKNNVNNLYSLPRVMMTQSFDYQKLPKM